MHDEPDDATRRQTLAALGILGGMAVAGPSAAAPMSGAGSAAAAIPVAVLLGEGATLIDFAGPWEILSSAAYAPCAGFNVYSVAASREPVICDDGRAAMGGSAPRSGLSVVPDYTFATAPQPRIVIIGAQLNVDDKKLDWIRHVAKTADLVASVCTGAFVLAKTGLLDGKAATTNSMAYDSFQKNFPKVKLVRGVRFVESGSVATATGLTAGMDLALRITERFYGRSVAQHVAGYEEWNSKGWIVGA